MEALGAQCNCRLIRSPTRAMRHRDGADDAYTVYTVSLDVSLCIYIHRPTKFSVETRIQASSGVNATRRDGGRPDEKGRPPVTPNGSNTATMMTAFVRVRAVPYYIGD